jgi:hypothetical protein
MMLDVSLVTACQDRFLMKATCNSDVMMSI